MLKRTHSNSLKLYCFSPPVMLATFLIEYTLAIYTIWRYKLDTTSRLAILILLGLGTFQLSEYLTCGGLGLSNIGWARIGYVSITLLPALGIHILSSIAGKKDWRLLGAAYASCAAFVLFYALASSAITGHACYANYAVFYTAKPIGQWFGVYYYGWLAIGTYLAWHWGAGQPLKRKALYSLALGYLVFILPTTAFNLIDPTTLKGIPSIMCGFGVILAITLVTLVLPNSGQKRQ